ncbi:hypothetical protein BDY24DRAFT_395821 [Mrakia frigida]|uniref:uncharacterized protein n=1 Tax=Mrakia frigida TaxID=29902 RepID=UPI003FCC2070
MSAHTLENSEGDRDGIRPFRPSDLKQVQLLVGAGVMEQLAATNKLAYSNPTTILVWLALSFTFIHFMNWWPQPDIWVSFFSPAFAFFLMAVPIMVAFEWQHRQYFEPLLRITLGLRDLNAIPEFYSLSPSSSFFVYSHRSAIIGCIAIDAARPGEELESILGSELNNTEIEDKKALEESKGTSNSVVASKSLKKRGANTTTKKDTTLTSPLVPTTQARIRHFHVDLLYKNATTSADLLEHALQHTFTESKQVEEIFAIDSPTKQLLGAVLKKEGFKESWTGPKGAKGGKKFGTFGLEEKWVSLERDSWERKQEVVKS